MAFMFETRFPQRVTAYAAGLEELQKDYGYYGHELKKHFDPNRPTALDHGAARSQPTIPKLRSWVASADGHPDFPIQNLPLGVFSPPAGGPRAGVAIGDGDPRPSPPPLAVGLFAGEARLAAEAASGAALNALLALGAGPRRALRARLSELFTLGSAERSKLEGVPARCRGLHAAPAGDDRRLHRLLRRHPPRDQCRQAVPAGQPAAAELQMGADRLSRPRLHGAPVRHAGAPTERPAQAPGRDGTQLRPLPQPGLRARARGLDRPRQRAGHARSRSGGRRSTWPATACSTTGRRATSRLGSTSRSGRSWPRASPPRSRPGS